MEFVEEQKYKKDIKKRLTKDEILNLVDDFKNGMSKEELSGKYDIGICSVRRHIRLNK